MKIVAFGDTHGDFYFVEEVKEKAEQAKLTICLGDMTLFSTDIEIILEDVNSIPSPVYAIHGNHESLKDFKKALKPLKNITFVHKKEFKEEEYQFLAFGGDGFSRHDPEFERTAKKWKKRIEKENIDPKKIILILHGPPINTTLDVPYDNYHSGSESYRDFIEEVQPLLVLVGHIHECEHESDLIGNSLVLNPGPDGELIDLKLLEKERKKLEKQKKS